MRIRQKKAIYTALIIGVTLSLIALGVVFYLDKTGRTSLLFTSNAQNAEDKSAKTTSTLPSAQSDFDSGDSNKDAGNTLNENQGSAGASDTNGQSSTSTGSPRTSSTNEITVYLPLDNAVVKSGQELSGTSSLSEVSYRIIDNVSGVIGSGTLKVVNGNFSGILDINSTASEGRIDVYGTRADLTEFSNIKIPVKFQ
jgi:hypothetical protein